MKKTSKLQRGVFKALLLEDTLDRLEDRGIGTRADLRQPALDELYIQDFSPHIRFQATQMQHVYVAFYCLENAVRELIAQRFSERHGANWWAKCAPKKIKEFVKKLREKDQRNKYHAQRSETNIGYTMFANLAQIIIGNWDDFSDLFPNQAWITSRFNDLEMSRNIIMHTNLLPSIEIDRIKSIVKDWLSQVG